MPDDLKIGIRLTADGKGFVGEMRVARSELDKLSGNTRKAGRATREFAGDARRGEAATRDFGASLSKTHGRLIGYIGGISAVVAAGRGIARHAESYIQISNAVRIATDTAAEHRQVQQELFDIAQRTRAPLAGVADLYQKIAISQDDLGASNDDLLAVIEGVGQALVINGTAQRCLEWRWVFRGGFGGKRVMAGG